MGKNKKTLLIQLGLFVVTITTTTLSGAEWLGKSIWMEDYGWDDFVSGFSFSIPFLLILTVHEFGHYFMAQYHRVKVTLPFYIPMWFLTAGPSIGTMGAFIQIREKVRSRQQYFDIGIAGPLAGFVVAVVILYIGFTNLPPQEYIYEIHPEYKQWGMNYPQYAYNDSKGISYQFGPTLMFWYFENFIADPELLPHPNEMIHYPLLMAGYLALFFTALNLLPMGQLDGGHVLYGLVGAKWHRRIATSMFLLFITYAGIGFINPHQIDEWFAFYLIGYLGFLYYALHSVTDHKKDRLMIASIVLTLQFFIGYLFPTVTGYQGWILFAFIIGRFIGVQHPPVSDDHPLSTGRKVLGWLAFVVFILCFSPTPLVID